jgi:ribonuclease P protein component
MDSRLRRCQRIRRAGDFQRLRTHGRRVAGHGHTVFIHRGGGPARIGLVTSRRTGNAVRRNRLRRIFREEFRQFPRPELDGWDICVVFRPEAKCARDGDMRESFRRTLGRIGGHRFLSHGTVQSASKGEDDRIPSL